MNTQINVGFATEAQGVPMRIHHIFGQGDMAAFEYGPDRIINLNDRGTPGHNDQKALLVLNDPIGNSQDMLGGATYPIDQTSCPTGGWSPNETFYIAIDEAKLQQYGIANGYAQVAIDNEVRRTVAHEIGHGMHLKHRRSNQVPQGCVQDSADPGDDDSVMSSGFEGRPPAHDFSKYNNDDRKQMRLHTR